MQTRFGKLSRCFHFCAATLLVAAQISIIARAAESASDPGTKITVHFPKDRSVGSLLLYPVRNQDKCRAFMQARGNVVLPAEAGLGLTLNFAGANDTSFLSHIEAPYLVSLDMGRFSISDAQAKDFSDLVALRNLNMEHTDIGDLGLQSFRELKDLHDLDISRTMVKGKSFALFSRFPKLAVLNLAHNELDNGSMFNLQTLKALEILRLGSCGLDDQALFHVGKLIKLKSLHLEANAKITDAGVAHVVGLKNLKFLDLTSTQITGACVKHLVQMTALTELHINLAKFKTEDIECLRRALAHCRISDSRQTHDIPVEIFAPLHSPIAPRH